MDTESSLYCFAGAGTCTFYFCPPEATETLVEGNIVYRFLRAMSITSTGQHEDGMEKWEGGKEL